MATIQKDDYRFEVDIENATLFSVTRAFITSRKANY